jgi:hypothetical protein
MISAQPHVAIVYTCTHSMPMEPKLVSRIWNYRMPRRESSHLLSVADPVLSSPLPIVALLHRQHA